MADNGLYTLKVQGEKKTYELREAENYALGALCDVLEDLTGYKSSYLNESVVSLLEINQEAKVAPANAGGFGGAPQFLVKRVT